MWNARIQRQVRAAIDERERRENQRQKNIRRISEHERAARLSGNIEFTYIRRFDNPRGSRRSTFNTVKLRLSASSDRAKECFDRKDT